MDTPRSASAVANVVVNPGFEDGAADVDAPLGWIIGRADESADRWALDEEIVGAGSSRSLRLEPSTQCVATQVLDAPVAELEGRTVTLSVDVRHDETSTPPTAMLLALNPDLPPDPLLQTGCAGRLQVAASRGREGRFVTLTSKFVATAPAASLQVTLIASGNGGRVWFDNVVVTID